MTETVIVPPATPKKATIEWDNSQDIKKIFQLINVLVDEPTIYVTETGLEVKAMDPSRVSLIHVTLPKEGSNEYDATELLDKQMKFAISVDYLLKRVLKNVYKDESIRFEIVQSGTDGKVTVILRGKLARQFEVPMLKDTQEYPPSPKVTLTHTSKLVLEDVNALFKDMEDHVHITGTSDTLTFTSADDLGKFEVQFHIGDHATLNIECQQEAKATFSVSYLKELLKALNALADMMTLRIATDMPLEIIATLGNKGTATTWLAPRITD